MVLRRNTFFFGLALLYIIVVGTPKLIWFLNSEKTTGIFAFQGGGSALDQFPDRSSFIYFFHGKDTIWFKSLPGLGLAEGSPVPVRFQKNDPQDAKLDRFRDVWLPTIVYGALPFLVLIVTFLHPHIVPWRSRVVLIPRKPFIKVIT